MYQTSTQGNLGYVLHHIAGDGAYYVYGGRGAVNGSSWDWSQRHYPNQDGSYVEYRTSARAPIFYDRDNTGYYCDPASTTNLNALTCISLTETSSKRYKENIYSLGNALEKVVSLRGVHYNKKGNSKIEIGVIAEEVAEIAPEVVRFNPDGTADSVAYGRLSALFIEAIKEQQIQIEELKKEIDLLKQR